MTDNLTPLIAIALGCGIFVGMIIDAVLFGRFDD